jgi:aminocarboxymuconate-semialdehyde decarboxylase
MHRRAFVTSLLASAAAACLPSADILALQAPGRREVRIGGRRVAVIDVHAHCAIDVESLLAGSPLAGRGRATGDLLLGPRRLEIMNTQGVDIQALTINGFWWYEAERALAEQIVRAQNEGLAAWVGQHRDRFVALASVALQFPELAAAQLEDGVKRLGMRGASIGGHVKGENLTAPRFDVFWAKAAELGVLVFMHPNNAQNLIRPNALAGPGGLDNIIGNPLETTNFLSRLMFDGTLDKFPGLRVGAAHGGGYLPSYIGRSNAACGRGGGPNCVNRRTPTDYLRSQITIDTMVFSEEGLRHLVAEAGVSQVVYGTDVPYDWPVTIDLVLNASFLSDADKVAILGGNLQRLLRIER